ncbi:putative membrane protein [Acinetobacter baumannii 1406589]|uniref:TrbC/VirB2 family protein n=1 Tax=Acinetobacter baumannii TaxID=470 RepID=UPI00044A2F94|nr:TrbC/VirB2 family protein [Acinetobacter baumannii]EXS50733.1 putative membrane protein [Acinetobacter baumannii 1406589]MDC4147473.1 TrbC/VirB2 family protein [Acinetobacter baumannii]
MSLNSEKTLVQVENNNLLASGKGMVQKAIAITIAMVLSSRAFALNGGFNTVSSTTSQVQTWIYAIVGVVAIIILLINVFMVWAKRSTWGDFLQTAGWVAMGGGCITFATWLYGLFAS